jgi:hypothetical protein
MNLLHTLSLNIVRKTCVLWIVLWLATTANLATAQALDTSEYGSVEKKGSALIGILYDTKQNQKMQRKKMGAGAYDELVNEFLASGWDERILNRYFRTTRALYTSQIYIPLSPAKKAPSAFGVQEVVRPSFWLVHYKGQVTPPTSGRWRFWGYGSEVCSVAVNGETVLASNWIEDGKLHPIPIPDVDWKSSAPPGRRVHKGLLTAGSWMDLKAGEIVDLDILIGERAGGNFCATLLIEKEGESYPSDDKGPIYPVFQLADFDTPVEKKASKAPPFMPKGPIWKGIQ